MSQTKVKNKEPKNSEVFENEHLNTSPPKCRQLILLIK